MYQDNVLQNVVRPLKSGKNVSRQAVLSATITGDVYYASVTIPDTATVVRVYSDLALRLALSETPALASTATFVVGAILNATEWGTFALANGLTRTLQMTAASTATITMDLY